MLTDNILDLIGNTPLVRLKGDRVFTKAEYLNPGGSIKDRVAVAMIEGAVRDGRLKPDSIITEPTSGNTGIGVALVGRLKGYQVRIVMPENMSVERKKLILALGAELVLTPAEQSLPGAVQRVRDMQAEDPRVFVCQQFENPDNPRVHYEETARELWHQMTGDVACFVAGVGSTRSRASATASSPTSSTYRWSTTSSRSRTKTPSRRPGSWAATTASSWAFRRARTYGPPGNWRPRYRVTSPRCCPIEPSATSAPPSCELGFRV